MGAGRENQSIWWLLAHRSYQGRWHGWRLLKLRTWRGPYVWHDSVGRYWAHWVTCRLFGHRPPVQVSDPGKPLVMHCFRCEKSWHIGGSKS